MKSDNTFASWGCFFETQCRVALGLIFEIRPGLCLAK